MKRLVVHLSCALLLLATLLVPSLRMAQAAGPAAPPSLVDQRFQIPVQSVDLLATAPVVDEPAVPPGAGVPGSNANVIAILAAAAGGFVIGMFVGVVGCCFLYYFSVW